MEEVNECICADLLPVGANIRPCPIHGWPAYGHNIPVCDTYWGSHGCDLDFGHDGPCICKRCHGDNLTPCGDRDCVGCPPYYGPSTEFFSNLGSATPSQTLAARMLPE